VSIGRAHVEGRVSLHALRVVLQQAMQSSLTARYARFGCVACWPDHLTRQDPLRAIACLSVLFCSSPYSVLAVCSKSTPSRFAPLAPALLIDCQTTLMATVNPTVYPRDMPPILARQETSYEYIRPHYCVWYLTLLVFRVLCILVFQEPYPLCMIYWINKLYPHPATA
jgi:hypothetical protein